MSRCRICGKEILWITMKTGRKMPVDPEKVGYVSEVPAFGDKTLITDDGRTIRCRYVLDGEQPDGEGYVPHWATCDGGGGSGQGGDDAVSDNQNKGQGSRR